MLFKLKRKLRASAFVAGAGLAIFLVGAAGDALLPALVKAQDATAKSDRKPPRALARAPAKHVRKEAITKTGQPQTAPAAAAPPALRLPGNPTRNFAARLEQAGATKCARRIDELADASMQGTTASANASSWFAAAPNERPVNLVIAQKFAAATVPYGATDIFASPAANARCDALALQVIPSPLSCKKLRQAVAARGKLIAELVGIPLLQDSNGQVMLVPTSSNTCVLIGLRIAYAP